MHNRKITKSLQNMMKQSGEPYDHSYPLVVKKIQIFLLNLLFFKIYAIAIFAHLPVTSRRTRGSIIGKILSKSFRKKGPAECIISERNVPELINAKSALVAATWNQQKFQINQKWLIFDNKDKNTIVYVVVALFRKKRFMLDEKFQQNASIRGKKIM